MSVCRVLRTLFYMLLIIHIEGCGYYAMSAYEGLGKNEWVFSGRGIASVSLASSLLSYFTFKRIPFKLLCFMPPLIYSYF